MRARGLLLVALPAFLVISVSACIKAFIADDLGSLMLFSFYGAAASALWIYVWQKSA